MRTTQQEYEKIKEVFEILSEEMDARDEDCAIPKNAVDKGYSLAVKHMKKEINKILSNIQIQSDRIDKEGNVVDEAKESEEIKCQH